MNDTDEVPHNRNRKWLTRQEVADRLRLPVKTLAEWASKGTGPPYKKFGRHTRYDEHLLEAWEDGQDPDSSEPTSTEPDAA